MCRSGSWVTRGPSARRISTRSRAGRAWCCAVVSQIGWWSLYSDLGLWGGAIGIPLVLVGFLGFNNCVSGHSKRWSAQCHCCCGGGPLGYVVIGLAATTGSTQFCPATGTVPTLVLDDWGRVVVDEWMSPEAAQLAAEELALAATPNCTDNCSYIHQIDHVIDHTHTSTIGSNHHSGYTNNARCDDGGLGFDHSYCPLGSDTADCGCRNGTTVADWLPPPELGPREYTWEDRAGHRGCWAKASRQAGWDPLAAGVVGIHVPFYISVCVLGLSLWVLLRFLSTMCTEVRAMWILEPTYVQRKSDGRTGRGKDFSCQLPRMNYQDRPRPWRKTECHSGSIQAWPRPQIDGANSESDGTTTAQSLTGKRLATLRRLASKHMPGLDSVRRVPRCEESNLVRAPVLSSSSSGSRA